MLNKRTIFEIHRMDHQGWSHRKIARHLCVARISVNTDFRVAMRLIKNAYRPRMPLRKIQYFQIDTQLPSSYFPQFYYI